MTTPQESRRRTLVGLVLAILVAPVVTALCVQVMALLTLDIPTINLADAIGGAFVFLLLAVFFGGLLAALPVLFFGSIAIAVARSVGTKSSMFYATAGILAGLVMAWIDTGRTKSFFNLLEAVPFVVGGCLSALAYWSVAQR